MKDDHPDFYDSPDLGRKVSAYAASHSSALPAHIGEYHARASSHEDAIMLTSNFQSQFHTLLANSIGAKRVLEIGVFLGYSAMVWSNAVGPDGVVTGLEFDPEFAKLAGDALSAAGATNVEIIVGPAAESLPKLKPTEPYDLVFIDADKPGYLGYVKQILAASQPGAAAGARLVRPGALIVADNVLQSGKTADGASSGGSIDAVREYNDYCVNEPRLQTVLLPLWDGLSVARIVD